MDLDIYLQGPDSVRVEEPAALILVTLKGQTYRQGTTRNGHLRWSEVAPLQYGIHIVAAGFEPAVQEIDAHGKDQFKVIVQLRPHVQGDKAYPPVSTDPEVNYIFGVYASKLGDWDKAKTYWAKSLELRPDHVPAMVSMSEALLIENKTTEARQYLDRATEADPSYWRTQAILADVCFRTGSAVEAVEHAQRAIALGHEEAASVSPLLARALMAEATEVLSAYVKDHPADVGAKKQLEGLNAPAELHGVEPLNAFGEMNAATVFARPAPRARESRWFPPEVDESVPPVEPGSACNLEEVLQKAGQRIQEFVKNVERFTATESPVHEQIKKSGEVSGTEKRQYDYVVSIEEIQPELFNVEEYRSSRLSAADAPGGIITRGLPALVLIFHPYYSGSFSMKCEGLANWNGKRAWQIYFRQRADKPNKIRSYKIGINAPSRPVALKGRAWFIADSYQIAGLQTDLIDTLPDVRLTVDHATVEYGPVHFSSRGVDMWLPQTAELYSDPRGKRIHRRLTFTNYLLFAVDDKERISAPKISP